MKLSNVLHADDYTVDHLAPAQEDHQAPNFDQMRRRSIQLPFAWGDATPASITPQVPADTLVVSVGLHIEQGFDGAGATLTVGDDADADRLMPADRNDPSTAASYVVHPGYRYALATTVKLAITPGAGATAGRGVLTMVIELHDY